MKGFIDIETSGFSITKNAVCEIALIAVNDNHEIVDTFHSLILPYKREDSDELCSYKDDLHADPRAVLQAGIHLLFDLGDLHRDINAGGERHVDVV